MNSSLSRTRPSRHLLTLGTGVGGDTSEDSAYDALNRLSQAKDDDSIVNLTYDSLSRVLTEVQGSNPLGTTGKTVSHSWDAESARTKIDYPSGFDANEARDALGRITAITDGSSATVASFDLYGAGLREKKRTLANSTYTAITYDGFRRPTDIDHKTSGGTRLAGFAYAWDKNDNPLMEQRSHQSGKGDVYSYDKVNRLTKVLRDVNDPVAELATPNSETYVNKLEYNMDDVFNLTSYVVTPYGGSASTTSYTTDAMNQYTAIGGQSPTYTDAGSLKDDGTLLYKYDAHQHLIEVRLKSSNALVAEYAYDALGLGRRITKVVGSATTRYVHAGQQAIEEWDGTGSGANLRRLFVFGERIDQIVAMEAPDQADVDSDSNTTEVLRFSFHTQLIGSVTQVSGPAGTVVESYEYDPYGKPTLKDQGGSTISASAIGNSYLFTARQLDEETGLYYYRARHYSADLRRFIERDPLEYVDGPNVLTYVGSRPISFSDPEGLHLPGYYGPGRGLSGWAPAGTDFAFYDPPEGGKPITIKDPRSATGGTITIDPKKQAIKKALEALGYDEKRILDILDGLGEFPAQTIYELDQDENGNVKIHIVIIVDNLAKDATEDKIQVWLRQLMHELGHAWLNWLAMQRATGYADAARRLKNVNDAYDEKKGKGKRITAYGDEVKDGEEPKDPLVPHTDHGRQDPYYY